MKLVPLVEVRNRNAPLYDIEHSRWEGARPSRTEADLIAMAAPTGEVHVRWLFQIEEAVCPEEDCGMCTMAPEDVAGFFFAERREQQAFLDLYGVEWDPEIRL